MCSAAGVGSGQLKPFLHGPGCPGPPSTVRSPKARSRLSSKSAPTAPAGMNPTSTAGLLIQSDGVRNVSAISPGEVGGCTICSQGSSDCHRSLENSRNNQIYSSCPERVYHLVPVCELPYRPAAPSLQHQRPDRRQHPTTCRSYSKTASISRSVHRREQAFSSSVIAATGERTLLEMPPILHHLKDSFDELGRVPEP